MKDCRAQAEGVTRLSNGRPQIRAEDETACCAIDKSLLPLISIRFRIILLAGVAILGVTAALFAENAAIRHETVALQHQHSHYVQAQAVSRLVRALQKERGLSGLFLASPTADVRIQLQRQRSATDTIIAASVDFPRAMEARTRRFARRLPAIRQRIMARAVKWPEVRTFYTHLITAAIDTIALRAMEDKPHHVRELMAVVELASAQEKMGLLRATLSRIYAQGSDDRAQWAAVADLYGRFNSHMHAFLRDDGRDAAAHTLPDAAAYREVNRRIETILAQPPASAQHHSATAWWSMSTRLIDTLYRIEMRRYAALVQAADRAVRAKRRELERYNVIALGSAAVVTLLAGLTLARMLRALGILLTTLDDVVRNENYAVRIRGESPRDEFGRISLSLNQLLDYTDVLIRNKEVLAATDLLTGMMNRRSFLEAAEKELRRSERYGGALSVIFVDIDHFKRINDSAGHATGDEVLRRVAQQLRGHVRESDLVARWGGEELSWRRRPTSKEGACWRKSCVRRSLRPGVSPSAVSVPAWGSPAGRETKASTRSVSAPMRRSTGQSPKDGIGSVSPRPRRRRPQPRRRVSCTLASWLMRLSTRESWSVLTTSSVISMRALWYWRSVWVLKALTLTFSLASTPLISRMRPGRSMAITSTSTE